MEMKNFTDVSCDSFPYFCTSKIEIRQNTQKVGMFIVTSNN